MSDADTLLQKIKNDFSAELKNNKKFNEILKKVTDGKGEFSDVSQISTMCGEILSKIFSRHISVEMLQNGLSYEIINTILQDTLRQNYELINRTAQAVQEQLDKALNIHIEPQKAEFPTERINSISSSLTDKTATEEQLQRRMNAPVRNVTDGFYSDYIEVNAKMRNNAGLKTYLIRQMNGKCCDWCASLAGKYEYPDNVPGDVFRKHDNCTCTLNYVTEKHRQNVWSKKKYALTPEQQESILANAPKPIIFTN